MVGGVTWQAMNLVTQGAAAAASLPKGVKPPTLEISDGQASIFARLQQRPRAKRPVNEATIDFGPIAPDQEVLRTGPEPDRVPGHPGASGRGQVQRSTATAT